MDEKKWAALLAAIVLAVGAGLYWTNHPAPAPAPPPAEPAAAPVAATPPEPDYPVPEPKADAPALPVLADSDAGIRAALSELIGTTPFEAYLVPDMLIRRIVVTVDNLPRDHVGANLRPLKRTPPPLLVRKDGGRILLSPANVERYSPQVALLKAIDPAALTALYFRWYPLFQRAYVDLGYPGKSFNNRLVTVLDHLLATPEPPAEIELVQPKVVFEFADPKLEALSSGQKTLLRLSAAQRAEVKARLSAIRTAIVAQGKP